jgi:hypothetical protein
MTAKQLAVRRALMAAVNNACKEPDTSTRRLWHILGWLMGEAGLSDDEAENLTARLRSGEQELPA